MRVYTNSPYNDTHNQTASIMGFQKHPKPLLYGDARAQEMLAWMQEGTGTSQQEHYWQETSDVTTISEPTQKATDNCALVATLEDIRQLSLLEDDWNDEGAPIISRREILRACKFVGQLKRMAVQQHFTGGYAPIIFPTISGGVTLYWQSSSRQIALEFEPNETTIRLMEKELDTPTKRRNITAEEAGDVAITAMREAS